MCDTLDLFRRMIFSIYIKVPSQWFFQLFGPDNLPPLEAFANGCPVIASRVCGSEDQLGDAVLMVDPTKPEEIAQAMLAVFQDESLRCELQKGLSPCRAMYFI